MDLTLRKSEWSSNTQNAVSQSKHQPPLSYSAVCKIGNLFNIFSSDFPAATSFDDESVLLECKYCKKPVNLNLFNQNLTEKSAGILDKSNASTIIESSCDPGEWSSVWVSDIIESLCNLSEDALFALANAITPSYRNKRDKLLYLEQIEKFLKYSIGDDAHVLLAGSTSYDADVDYTNLLSVASTSDLDVEIQSTRFGSNPRAILCRIYHDYCEMMYMVRENGLKWPFGNSTIKRVDSARVPIVIFKTSTDLVCDVSVNTANSVAHTTLFREIISQHPMLRPFMRIVKHWLKFRGIPTMKEGGFPSIMWMLLFCNSVLPNLHLNNKWKSSLGKQCGHPCPKHSPIPLDINITLGCPLNSVVSPAELDTSAGDYKIVLMDSCEYKSELLEQPRKSKSCNTTVCDPSKVYYSYSSDLDVVTNSTQVIMKCESVTSPRSDSQDSNTTFCTMKCTSCINSSLLESINHISCCSSTCMSPMTCSSAATTTHSCTCGENKVNQQSKYPFLTRPNIQDNFNLLEQLSFAFATMSRGNNLVEMCQLCCGVKTLDELSGEWPISDIGKSLMHLIELDPTVSFATWLVFHYELRRATQIFTLYNKYIEIVATLLLSVLFLGGHRTVNYDEIKQLAFNIKQRHGIGLDLDLYATLQTLDQDSIRDQVQKQIEGVAFFLNIQFSKQDSTILQKISHLIRHLMQNLHCMTLNPFEKNMDRVYSIPASVEPPTRLVDATDSTRIGKHLWSYSGWLLVVFQGKLCVVKVVKANVDWDVWWSGDFLSRRDCRSLFHGFIYYRQRLEYTEHEKLGEYFLVNEMLNKKPNLLICRSNMILFHPFSVVCRLNVMRLDKPETGIESCFHSMDEITGKECLYLLPGFEAYRICCFERIFSDLVANGLDPQAMPIRCCVGKAMNCKEINASCNINQNMGSPRPISHKKLRHTRFVLTSARFQKYYQIMQQSLKLQL